MATREEIRTIVREAARLRLTRGGQDTEPMLRRALAMAEQTFGPDSEEAMAPLEELARVLHIRAGCLVTDPEGLELNERAYLIARRFPGENSRTLVHMMDSLGIALVNTADGLDRGLQLMRDASSLVQGNPHLADLESWTTMKLAHTLMSFGRFGEALPVARRFLEIESAGARNFMYTHALLTVGTALLEVGNLAEALEVLEKAKLHALQNDRPKMAREAERLSSEANRRMQRASS